MAVLPPYVVIPLGTAFLYAVAALLLKRVLHPGADLWRMVFLSNWVAGLLFVPLFFFHRDPVAWQAVLLSLVPALTFLAGQIFTFLALHRGDVSVATPVLGSKVLFVAAFSVVLTQDRVAPPWWGAALLTVAATVLLAGGAHTGGRARLLVGIGYGFAAACSFALTDVLVQRWGAGTGPFLLLPVMFLGVAVFSVAVVPFFGPRTPLPRAVWVSLVAGSIVLGSQALAMGFTLATFGHATVVNVVYSSRGLWSIVLVWTVGRWLGNTEGRLGHAVLLRRAVGSLLLVAAIWLVI